MLFLVQVATVLVKLTCLTEHVQSVRFCVVLVLPVVIDFPQQFLSPWATDFEDAQNLTTNLVSFSLLAEFATF